LLERDPDLYLDEVVEQLSVQQGIDVSLVMVWRTFKALGLTRMHLHWLPQSSILTTLIQQLSKPAAERCEDVRQQFSFIIGAETPESLLFLDESAVDLRMTYRQMGWSRKGCKAKKSSNFVRGKQ
jgi:hypothetical protein